MVSLGTGEKLIVGALHLPPFPGTQRAKARTLHEIEEYAIANARVFAQGGVNGLCIQESDAGGPARDVWPEVIAYMTSVGRAVRQVFDGVLGVLVAGHGAAGPLAIADAIDAQFVRLKVYVGAMVKAEGLVEGCARDAILFRERIGATRIALMADVYDRTGTPLGDMRLADAATWAVSFGSADALVLTGQTWTESLDYIAKVRTRNLGVPLLIGGSVDGDNIGQALTIADGVIVSSSLKYPHAVDTYDGIVWDVDRIRALVAAASVVGL
jgi:membrane complex biogenesis BtpA family protein